MHFAFKAALFVHNVARLCYFDKKNKYFSCFANYLIFSHYYSRFSSIKD